MPPMSSYFPMKYFESSPIFQSFRLPTVSHYGFPSRTNRWERHQKKRFWWMMPDFFIPTKMHLWKRERETNEEIGKFFQSLNGNDDIWEQREWRAFVCLFIFDMISHIKWYVVFSDLFSNANMELGGPSTRTSQDDEENKSIF